MKSLPPSIGQIQPKFNKKALYRRMLLQKQSELKRTKHVKQLSDVNNLMKRATNNEQHQKRLAGYLNQTHSFWKEL